jgi:muramoyltetrapeptide carboxypeptidase
MLIPEYLKKGDHVAVVATAKKVHAVNTEKGIEILKSWGLEVEVGKHVFDSHQMFAGTDEHRLDDLQKMINDPDIRAIFMVRGGYGTTRIIDQVDFNPLQTNPKWICGFSDITALHNHLFRLGIASIHAPMPSFFYSLREHPLHWLQQLLFGNKQKLQVDGYHLNRPGIVSGKLVGGNLSIICHTIGTNSEIIADGNILFIEDVGEQLYNLDRMLVQLKRAGFLSNLKALIVGQFTEMKDDDPFGLEPYEIVYSHVSEYDYPVAFNFPIGHTTDNYALPVGVDCKMNISKDWSNLELG